MLGSFTIILGNAVLHTTLFMLTYWVDVPPQELMNFLILTKVKEGEYECVAAEEIDGAITFARNVHLAIAVVLLYIEFHMLILPKLASRLESRKRCCYRESKNKILDMRGFTILSNYMKQLLDKNDQMKDWDVRSRLGSIEKETLDDVLAYREDFHDNVEIGEDSC